jgi:hypothetical protein
VASITIGIRIAKTGKVTHPEQFGELRLHAALRKKPIVDQRQQFRLETPASLLTSAPPTGR